jgi:hypothetical protein
MRKVWPVGTLVAEKGAERSPHGLRVVVGHKPDGRCMTTYVSPPPWLPPAQKRQIFVGGEGLLTQVSVRELPPNAPAPQPIAAKEPLPARAQRRRPARRSASGRFLAWLGERFGTEPRGRELVAAGASSGREG